MVMSIGAITRVLRGEKRIAAKGAEIWAKRGGWSEVAITRNGETVRFKVRSPRARFIASQGKEKYSSVEDRLYSEWIRNTRAGQMHTARRQVEGMLKTALRKGDMEMAEQLEHVLSLSDPKVEEFYGNWTDAMTDSAIEEYYSYDTRSSGFPELLEKALNDGSQDSRIR